MPKQLNAGFPGGAADWSLVVESLIRGNDRIFTERQFEVVKSPSNRAAKRSKMPIVPDQQMDEAVEEDNDRE